MLKGRLCMINLSLSTTIKLFASLYICIYIDIYIICKYNILNKKLKYITLDLYYVIDGHFLMKPIISWG